MLADCRTANSGSGLALGRYTLLSPPWVAVRPPRPRLNQGTMHINPDKCVACGNCVPICPMGAIAIDPAIRRARIDADVCVECYQCLRGMSQEHLNPTFVRGMRTALGWLRLRFDPEPDVCPTASFEADELEWPRVVRRAFSDVTATHESTGIHGRGTEEVKTNDVTHRVLPGEAGFVVEFGRPSIGVYFRDIQRMTIALAAAGAAFEDRNPVTQLMSSREQGLLRADILGEKVLSAIVEFKTPLPRVDEFIDTVERISTGLPTIVALGVAAVCDELGRSPIEEVMVRRGYPIVRGKTNLGLGRVTNPAAQAVAEHVGVGA
jgi:ferredoxin